jgi:hypothetical protein
MYRQEALQTASFIDNRLYRRLEQRAESREQRAESREQAAEI